MELKKRKWLFKASSHMSGVLSSCQEFWREWGKFKKWDSGIDDVSRHHVRWREGRWIVEHLFWREMRLCCHPVNSVSEFCNIWQFLMSFVMSSGKYLIRFKHKRTRTNTSGFECRSFIFTGCACLKEICTDITHFTLILPTFIIGLTNRWLRPQMNAIGWASFAVVLVGMQCLVSHSDHTFYGN